MTHTELGRYGEELAATHLLKQGYKILDRNFRFKKSEIDIIAFKDNTLTICEVKTRVTAEIGEPYKAVTRSKQRQIISTANHYIRLKHLFTDVQFDVISIVHNSMRTKIEHIPDAFSPLL